MFGPLGLSWLGLGSASPAFVFLLFRKIGFFKGTPYKGGGLKFVPSYSEVRSFMKDSLRVLLEIRGSLVRVTRESAEGGVGVIWSFCSRRVGRKMLSSRCDALSGEGVLSA